jgi:subtilisin family serine protease
VYSVRYGGKTGKRYRFTISNKHVVVCTNSRDASPTEGPIDGARVSAEAHAILNKFELVTRFREAGVEILRAKDARGARSLCDSARTVLKREPEIEFAGRLLVDPSTGNPVIYTKNLFVKFDSEQRASICRKHIKDHGLIIKRELDYAQNAYFIAAPEDAGLSIFEIAERLLREPSVELCHPELIREACQRAAFPQQWHLKETIINGRYIDQHASVKAAWLWSDGTSATIAVIDDGVDIDHKEFSSPGKIVAPRDVSRRTNDPRPTSGDNHGTACAGVACADGKFGASGVAPRARLMPIRQVPGLGSQAEADAFVWAARNGADVISCSWGPKDGNHRVVPLPDSTRLAMEFAITKGRNGKGCVICFAAGNGNERIEKDGYASFDKVIAVAACNDLGKRASYSDFGKAVWCAFPSNDHYAPGIWTTDRSGPLGINPGGTTSKGDTAGNFTDVFGMTSSACAGVAGVAALIISRNPNLRWNEVKEIIKRSCDKIDPEGSNYDVSGHSLYLGYGRVNAEKAVQLADAYPLLCRSGFLT